MIIIIILLLIPTGFERAKIYLGTERRAVRVISCGNSGIIDTGLVRSGEQRCEIEILSGIFKGRTADAVNMLTGSLENDKLFSEGDKAYAVISYSEDEILSVTMTDHYRIDREIILAAIFAVFLIVFSGKIGMRSVLSFILTVLLIWKLVVPLYLKGYDPIISEGLIIIFLSLIIVSLVYGFDKRTLAASLGITAGIIVTAVTGIIFTNAFKIHGAVIAYSESCIALLMVFMAQGTPVGNILNYKYISAEIVHTVVGSFGLVCVAPLTAFTSGMLLASKEK